MRASHVVLRTDADAEHANELVHEFEELHAALRGVVGQTEGIEGEPIEVVVFEQEREYRERAQANETFAGFFAQQLLVDLEPHPTVVFYLGRWNKTGRHDFLHETVHRFVAATAPNAPPWINEGLALYYESLRVEDGVATLGEPPGSVRFWPQADLAFRLRTPTDEVPKVAELVAADRETFYGAVEEEEPTKERANRTFAFYGGAWVLVHMLMHGPPEYGAALGRTMHALQQGKSAKEANAEGLGRMNPDEVERAFRAYLERSKAALRGVRVKDVAMGTVGAPRAMADVEVHLLWSRLRAKDGTLDASLAEVDEALREANAPEAQHQRGIVLMRQKHPLEALRWLDAAVNASPAEPRYLLGEIQALHALYDGKPNDESDAKLNGLYARLAKVAVSASQLEAVGRYHRFLQRPEDALAVLDRAVRKDPTCWSCWDERSLVLLDQGAIEEARAASDRALAYLPEGARAPGLKAHRREIEKLAALPAGARPSAMRVRHRGPGRLAPKAIRDGVRRGFDAFDACYTKAPPREPKLSGRVAVRFTIGADGAVKDARDEGSDLPDAAVVACVVEAFGALKFPAPEGGSLEVIYPLVFSPGK